MDERQAQIREGAGLDEARLNVEFIDFLKKWSTPLLVVVAVIAVGYFGWQKRKEMRTAALAAAFQQFEAAKDSGNPAGLLAVAEEHRGQGAVSLMAQLEAADIHLGCYRAGLAPGARVDATGKPEDESMLLSEADRAKQLDEAAILYQKVIEESSDNPDLVQHAIGATYGLAAVAECRGKIDEARKHLEQIEHLAQVADMPEHIELAKQRIDSLVSLAAVPKLIARTDIPASMAGSLPDGVRPAPNPFAGIDVNAATSAQDPNRAAPQVPGPVPQEPETAGPQPSPAPQEPETPTPGGVLPGETPSSEPAKPDAPKH